MVRRVSWGFRDYQVAAPLNRVVTRQPLGNRLRFRDYQVAAPLKLDRLRRPLVDRAWFPRLSSRGPIEASRSCPVSLLAAAFPRLSSRGPIEAARKNTLAIGWKGCFRDYQVAAPLKRNVHAVYGGHSPRFPRLSSRGPIEAFATWPVLHGATRVSATIKSRPH